MSHSRPLILRTGFTSTLRTPLSDEWLLSLDPVLSPLRISTNQILIGSPSPIILLWRVSICWCKYSIRWGLSWGLRGEKEIKGLSRNGPNIFLSPLNPQLTPHWFPATSSLPTSCVLMQSHPPLSCSNPLSLRKMKKLLNFIIISVLSSSLRISYFLSGIHQGIEPRIHLISLKFYLESWDSHHPLLIEFYRISSSSVFFSYSFCNLHQLHSYLYSLWSFINFILLAISFFLFSHLVFSWEFFLFFSPCRIHGIARSPPTNPLRYYHFHVRYRRAHAKEIIKKIKINIYFPFYFYYFLLFIPLFWWGFIICF
jgi:hypothetical protein